MRSWTELAHFKSTFLQVLLNFPRARNHGERAQAGTPPWPLTYALYPFQAAAVDTVDSVTADVTAGDGTSTAADTLSVGRAFGGAAGEAKARRGVWWPAVVWRGGSVAHYLTVPPTTQVIGIDLGTTFSCVAVFNEEKGQVGPTAYAQLPDSPTHAHAHMHMHTCEWTRPRTRAYILGHGHTQTHADARAHTHTQHRSRS